MASRDRHGKEIPSRDLVARVECGGGAVMTIVNPYSEDHVEWALRYGNVERMRYVAASCLDSYDYLLSTNITMKVTAYPWPELGCFGAFEPPGFDPSSTPHSAFSVAQC